MCYADDMLVLVGDHLGACHLHRGTCRSIRGRPDLRSRRGGGCPQDRSPVAFVEGPQTGGGARAADVLPRSWIRIARVVVKVREKMSYVGLLFDSSFTFRRHFDRSVPRSREWHSPCIIAMLAAVVGRHGQAVTVLAGIPSLHFLAEREAAVLTASVTFARSKHVPG